MDGYSYLFSFVKGAPLSRRHPRFSAWEMVRPDVTPDAPYDEQPVIGLIGMGEMGRMYAKHLSKAGWMR